VNIDIVLTDPQIEFIESDANHPAIVGGLGSGKTKAGTLRLVLLMIEQRGINSVYGMPSYDLLSLRAIPGTEDDLRTLGIDFTTNKSSYTIHMHGYGDIIFRSYDRPERWVAFECAHGVLDELDILSKDKAALVWRKATERIRQRCNRGNTLAVVCTPDGGVNGFIYEKWVKKQQAGYELIKASSYSNPYLPDGYIDQIIANYDPTLADLYLNGEFVSLNQNKIYHFFDRLKHHTSRTIQGDDYLHIGIDFNIGGCCAVVFVIENNNPIAVDEFTSHDTRDFINNLTRYKEHKILIYPDASGKSGRTNSSQSDIQIIESAGYQCRYNASNPAVRDRINAYNGLIAHNRFAINTDKCPNLTNALETQGYDNRGEPEKWSDHPAIDDWTDSSGYFIAYRYPVMGRGHSSIKLGGI
jgi:phage terminase large subunit